MPNQAVRFRARALCQTDAGEKLPVLTDRATVRGSPLRERRDKRRASVSLMGDTQ